MDSRPSFRLILAKTARKNAVALERKARLASWLAKSYPDQAGNFYQIKHAAINQLFRMPRYAPTVRAVELAPSGDVILSLKYACILCLQHILLNRLDEHARGMLPRWATARAVQEPAA